MKKIIKYALIAGFAALFTGCATTTTVTTYSLPNVDSKGSLIYVNYINNDRHNMKEKIERKLVNTRIFNKPFFQLTDKPSEADIVISGSLGQLNSSISRYDSGRKENICPPKNSYDVIFRKQVFPESKAYNRSYANKYSHRDYVKATCKTRPVYCMRKTYDVTFFGEIIKDNKVTKRMSFTARDYSDTCSNHLGDMSNALNNLTEALSTSVVNYFTPKKEFISVKFMEDLQYSYKDSKILDLQENFIDLVDNYKYEAAIKVSQEIKKLTFNEDYVPFYNEGLIYESKGKLDLAEKEYQNALKLDFKGMDQALIEESLNRVSSTKFTKSKIQ